MKHTIHHKSGVTGALSLPGSIGTQLSWKLAASLLAVAVLLTLTILPRLAPASSRAVTSAEIRRGERDLRRQYGRYYGHYTSVRYGRAYNPYRTVRIRRPGSVSVR